MGNSRRAAAAAVPASELEVGFAKLQGEDFEYYMQTYSIILGRLSRKKHQHGDAAPDDVDVDLGILGGGMNVSRRHARIFYDFARRRFALEVLGKNGCLVEGVLHVPGSPPVKLDSQDLLQMGDAQFYFLLPSRSVFDTDAARRAPRRRSAGATATSLLTTRRMLGKNERKLLRRRSGRGTGMPGDPLQEGPRQDQRVTGKQITNNCCSWKRKMLSHQLLPFYLISVDLRNGCLWTSFMK